MTFDLGEELSAIQAAARAFAEKEIRPRLREIERNGVPEALAARYDEAGFAGLDLAESAGGHGLSITARAIVEEELSTGDLGAAVALDRGGAAAVFLAELASPEQAARLLGAGGRGPAGADRGRPLKGRLALALSEEGASRADFKTTARRAGSDFIVDGKKAYVLRGGDADLWVVLAQLEPGPAGIAAFAVASDERGVRRGKRCATLGLNAVPVDEVVFEGCRVPAAARLGDGDLTPRLCRAFDRLQVIVGARAVGVARAAYDYALRYAEERTAFGKPISHFQAIAFALADMATQVDAARWMVWRAAGAVDRGEAAGEPAQALVQAHEAAAFVTDWAVQLLGGAGYLRDHPVEKWMRDAKTLALYGATAEAATAAVASAVLGRKAAAEDLPLPETQPVLT